ncbi:MAG: hypothetical protein B6V02_03925 [Thermoprotei archaeon ex4572_64]|nr:MAG: hypothetical protein B6V02_03925 [Thermoprotei archaeon ex4572_64]
MSIIKELFETIEKYISELDKKVSTVSVDVLVNDFFNLNAVLHILQVSIQALIDMSMRLLSIMGRNAKSYSDVPKNLEELKILSSEEAIMLKKIIGFRNVIVHSYTKVKIDIVKKILTEKLYLDIVKLAYKVFKASTDKGIDC